MTYFTLGELSERVKRLILWFIIKVIFLSRELREEATIQCNSKVVLIPGVFYGLNVIRGYQAIGQQFPNRCRTVRMDYIIGYIKFALIAACTVGFFFLLWQL